MDKKSLKEKNKKRLLPQNIALTIAAASFFLLPS
jgi:hypothetical protein